MNVVLRLVCLCFFETYDGHRDGHIGLRLAHGSSSEHQSLLRAHDADHARVRCARLTSGFQVWFLGPCAQAWGREWAFWPFAQAQGQPMHGGTLYTGTEPEVGWLPKLVACVTVSRTHAHLSKTTTKPPPPRPPPTHPPPPTPPHLTQKAKWRER